jgi:hypothetical protein
VKIDSIEEENPVPEEPTPDIKNQSEEINDVSTNTSVKQKESSRKTEKASPVKQPELKPFDPTDELNNNSISENGIVLEDISEQPVSNSSVQIETDNTNKKFDFHYAFNDNKLLLYGSFEKDLYTILEFFNNNKRTVFLHYNSNYYLLDESVEKPTPLKALNDPVLIQKLREYKGK